MPTSVPWRSGAVNLENNSLTVSRPSASDIEPCSPEPFLPSYSAHLDSPSSKRYSTYDPQLYGLGLSKNSYTDNDTLIPHPDHLYIDQNGGAHISVKPRSLNRHAYTTNDSSRERRNGETRSNKSDSKLSKPRGHTRSGSTIDDLANIAIATSPTFNNGSPTSPYSGRLADFDLSRPATSHVDNYGSQDRFSDRPTKRIRSEKLHPAEWSSRDERPRTSHALQTQPSMEDAELLLSLRNGHSFSTNTSPVFASAATFQPPPVESLIHPPAVEEITPKKVLEHLGLVENEQEEDQSAETDQIDIEKGGDLSNEDMMEVDRIPEEPQPPQLDDLPREDNSHESAQEEVTARDRVEIAQHSTPETLGDSKPAHKTKKPTRKIKPEVQAEVCASCQKLQRDDKDEDSPTLWIGCEYCKKWFHLACEGFRDKTEARSVDKYVCKECEPDHGQTTFVRKSSRVRTAIDYAGLNEGLVKSSEDSSMHHYIQPIKDGHIRYQHDDFARVRPEILTAEFWENMDNMKRPFVVPACWNPRFGVSDETERDNIDSDMQPTSEPSLVTCDANGQIVQGPLPTALLGQDREAITQEVVMECDQDYLDMVMPRHLTVRKVSDLYGPEQPVPVIDVKSQETKGQWTLNDWANYYEQPGDKPVRNVISLEVSNSPIGKLIRRPRAVRDIDLEDDVWDNETRTTSNKRPVQFYCLMSVADSYTDFHIDFGGSSVYYHILKGVKTFFFIPPEDRYLKEYEKWCNSETQNDTWLGDLCNGNVTRVDLHEGDTAFIPAGWIHSVWTPEDSLVIGGNFLTRLDYELQLKVANIEKTTRVPQKFRYPFFQKVMWYTLLKYLEEDPVPEEVLRDFHADEDYHFLRANPIWLEHGELASDAEPGDPAYSARVYPKAELKGLPYLRDYLYRTACIHADIPVPDINKKQIDAVKASIPKGHGDPLRLIKTFAVWCAWKLGNEPVPKWVHDQGDGLVAEIKEREKAKEETFRVPPERISARNASKIKATSPGVGSDGNENMSSKSKNGSRGGSLRVACDACRKRRIKCRHKEGDDTLVNASPPEIRPRTYSNVSVDIPKLASASPANPTFDQSPTVNGTTQDFSTSEVAQAALASLHSQSSDSTQMMGGTPTNGSAKKGRSKACEECRKSKVSNLSCTFSYHIVDHNSVAASMMSTEESTLPRQPSHQSLEVQPLRSDLRDLAMKFQRRDIRVMETMARTLLTWPMQLTALI